MTAPRDEPLPCKVANAATMWRSRRNSAEIARALKISEPAALRLLALAKECGKFERGDAIHRPARRPA